MRQFGLTVFRRKNVTLQYPAEKPTLAPAYRSAIKLIRFEETNTHDCVACKACENICPSYCIKLSGGKVEGIKKKRVAEFEMDFSLCSLCGLCLDVCPTDTLEYSKAYDEAGYNRDWRVDLLAEFRDFEPEFIEQQREIDAKAAAEKAAKMEAAKAAKAKADAAKAAAEAEDPQP
jgi:NADH-quinone oxidoreductase subunit I